MAGRVGLDVTQHIVRKYDLDLALPPTTPLRPALLHPTPPHPTQPNPTPPHPTPSLKELEEAIAAKDSIEHQLSKLRAAIEGKDSAGIKAAIVDCGIEMLKTTIEAITITTALIRYLRSGINNKCSMDASSRFQKGYNQ